MKRNRHQLGYTNEWAAASKQYLSQHRWCIKCQAPSKEVDHIQPHKGNQRLMWDVSNWQALCKPCHSRKTRAASSWKGYRMPNSGSDVNGMPLTPQPGWGTEK
jgi:5-methylcytosine-specific restriction endonuclease McrA